VVFTWYLHLAPGYHVVDFVNENIAMKIKILYLTVSIMSFIALSFASEINADTVDARCDIYLKGEDRASATIPCTFSQRQGYINIVRSDGVSHELEPTGTEPGNFSDQDGRPVYRQSGLGKDGLIFRFPDESVFVYWDAVWGTPKGFDQTFELQGISFHVSSPNNSSINTLTIQPSGLEIDNSSMEVEIDGTVTSAEIADLDSNGWPEIYVYVNSAGSGGYGSLVAYAVNNGKSVSDIYLPPISDDKVNSVGYMGHDEFAVVESTFVQRFPIYLENDTNASPSGGIRQLQYKLTMGEASWVLKLDRVVEY